jgi:hypothetical protein
MYKAILFSTDGDYVTDYRGCEDIEEVEAKLANQGSRWYFYPFEFVVKDYGYSKKTDRGILLYQRIVSAPEYPQELKFLKGKSVRTAQKYIKKYGEDIARALGG